MKRARDEGESADAQEACLEAKAVRQRSEVPADQPTQTAAIATPEPPTCRVLVRMLSLSTSFPAIMPLRVRGGHVVGFSHSLWWATNQQD